MIEAIHRILGISVGLVSMLALFLMTQFPSVWWGLLIVLIVWALLIAGGQFGLYKLGLLRKDLPVLSGVTMLALVSLLFFVEQQAVRWFLIVIGPACLGLLHAWTVRPHGYTTHIEKSYRRIIMMLWVFNAYALLTAVYAIDMFFSNVSFWLLSILAASIFSYIAWMVWQMYYNIGFRRALIWIGAVWLLSFELIWLARMLPFAYTVLGLIVTWIWYIIQLYFRFHFSDAGIVWKKQRVFLITNAGLLFILLTFIVRWR